MRVGILGATGFVGRNIYECLKSSLQVIPYGRTIEGFENYRHLDLFDENTWSDFLEQDFDVVINAAAYGVVKTQQDLNSMYETNYFKTVQLIEKLRKTNKVPYWVQIGTAFEYDLRVGDITEQSVCQPFTHYGISKLMCSNYLLSYLPAQTFTILRPFGMFGKYEDRTKIFPALLTAQFQRKVIDLSNGEQKRDYLYVQDLATFLLKKLLNRDFQSLPSVLNVGSGQLNSLRSIAENLASEIEGFNSVYWNWGAIAGRSGEADYFYNASLLSSELGLVVSDYSAAFKEILPYYKQ